MRPDDQQGPRAVGREGRSNLERQVQAPSRQKGQESGSDGLRPTGNRPNVYPFDAQKEWIVSTCLKEVKPGESIQAAIDALPAEGGVVELAPGTHHVRDTIRIKTSNVAICGTRGSEIMVHDPVRKVFLLPHDRPESDETGATFPKLENFVFRMRGGSEMEQQTNARKHKPVTLGGDGSARGVSRRSFIKRLGAVSGGMVFLSAGAGSQARAQYGGTHAEGLSAKQLTTMYTDMLRIRL